MADGDDKRLREAARECEEKIGASSIFLSLYTKNFDRDPMCAMQFGMAVMMDKPIYLLLEKGQPLPGNVRRMARAIEEFDKDDLAGFEQATKRLCAAADAEMTGVGT